MAAPIAAKLVGGAAAQVVRPRNMGQFTFGSGRWERVTDINTTGTTWEYIFRRPFPIDAIQVCLSVGPGVNLGNPTVIMPKAFVGVASPPKMNDADVTTASVSLASFAGNNNPDVLVSAALGRRTYQWSDVIPVYSVPATDGLGGYLTCIRVNIYMPSTPVDAGGTPKIITMGDTPGTDAFAAWANHPTRPFRLRSKGGGFAGPGAWINMGSANSSVASTGPLGMVRALYRGSVVNVLTVDDSTGDGRGTYIGDGPVSKACSLLSTGQTLFEHTNLGWSGANVQLMYQNLIDYLAAGSKADIFFVPSFFTNNVASGPIPASGNFSIAWMQGYRARMEALLDMPGVRTILQTSTPANYAARNWGASDALRIAGDNDIRAMASRGRVIFDKGAGVTGPVDSNGQQTLINNIDDIHQGDAGIALEAVNAAAAIRRLCIAPDGLLAG